MKTSGDEASASLIQLEQIKSVTQIAEKTRQMDEARANVVDVVHNLTSIAEENAANTEETSALAANAMEKHRAGGRITVWSASRSMFTLNA